jgi:hypothetical protein
VALRQGRHMECSLIAITVLSRSESSLLYSKSGASSRKPTGSSIKTSDQLIQCRGEKPKEVDPYDPYLLASGKHMGILRFLSRYTNSKYFQQPRFPIEQSNFTG